MTQYEVTFIVDPILSAEEIKETAELYISRLKEKGCEIVHIQEWGIRQMAYAIKKRQSAAYFTVEFKSNDPELIPGLELAFRRDERILRYLSVRLDKHGVKYNDDKRKGLIGKKKKQEETSEETPAKA